MTGCGCWPGRINVCDKSEVFQIKVTCTPSLGAINVRFQATANPPQLATLGAFETGGFSAELGRLLNGGFRENAR